MRVIDHVYGAGADGLRDHFPDLGRRAGAHDRAKRRVQLQRIAQHVAVR